MASDKLTISEALQVSAEARALLSASIGPEDQAKVKKILAAALDSLIVELGVEEPVKKSAAKAEKK